MRALAITWTNGKTYLFYDPMWTDAQTDAVLEKVKQMFSNNAAQWTFGEEPEAWTVPLHFPEPLSSPLLMSQFVKEKEIGGANDVSIPE